MRFRLVLALALSLAAAPTALSATEVNPRSPGPAHLLPQPALQPMLPTTVPHSEMMEIPVRAEQARVAREEAALRQPDRTSWWWLVGAIVLGGLIVLALA